MIEKPGLTIRAAVIAIVISLFLLTSSTYIALKFGLLPWPIIFSVIVSGGLLKLVNRGRPVNIHEINCAQAGASVGGLVAGGIAFTIPGILYLNQERGLALDWPNSWGLALITMTAGLLGVLLSIPLKQRFIDEEQLPYPAGTAGAELLQAGKTGGRQLALITLMAAAAGIFALLRDIYFPGGLSFRLWGEIGVALAVLPLPILVGGGFILGPRSSFSWLAGAIFGWIILAPLLVMSNITDINPVPFLQNLGMGMVLGAGVGFFCLYIFPRLRKIFSSQILSGSSGFRWLWTLLVASPLALMLVGVPALASILTVIGVWLTVAIAARMTGETNIDPLEQFGIFIGLIVTGLYQLFNLEISLFAVFLLVTFVSVACAIAGDVGHDYKSASIIGTRFRDIVTIDLIAVAAAGLMAPIVLTLTRSAFGDILFTPEMPAPQAKMVASSIFGFERPDAFRIGFAGAFVLELGNRLLPNRLQNKLLLMPMGIGLFLGTGVAIPLALGALIRWYVDRHHSHLYQAGILIAAGVMGGEGFAGFSAGALTVFGIDRVYSSLVLTGVFAFVLVIVFIRWLQYRETAT